MNTVTISLLRAHLYTKGPFRGLVQALCGVLPKTGRRRGTERRLKRAQSQNAFCRTVPPHAAAARFVAVLAVTTLYHSFWLLRKTRGNICIFPICPSPHTVMVPPYLSQQRWSHVPHQFLTLRKNYILSIMPFAACGLPKISLTYSNFWQHTANATVPCYLRF